MAILAIEGHVIRGKEVIEILEMLGGTNRENCWGVFDTRLYLINAFGYIEDRSLRDNSNYQIYTLEEFLEKFPYKVGDRVIIEKYGQIFEILSARWCDERNIVIYQTSNGWYYANELQPYKEETMKEIIKIDIPKGYEFAGVDDDNQQVVFEKIGYQYPKTYEECRKILGCKADDFFTNFGCNGCEVEISDYEDKIDDLVQNFRKLRYARDAYWKIAGWNPKVKSDVFYMNTLPSYLRDLFPMPTEEMVNAFYENFKDKLEICKELLL